MKVDVGYEAKILYRKSDLESLEQAAQESGGIIIPGMQHLKLTSTAHTLLQAP